MTFMQELHTFINAQAWKPGTVEFDVNSKGKTDPWFNMVSLSDPGALELLCADDAGQTIVEFHGYGSDKFSLWDDMAELRMNLRHYARNGLATFELWDVRCTGVIGFGTEDENIYHYTFEMITRWEG